MGITQEQWEKDVEKSQNAPKLKTVSDGYFYAKREVQDKLSGRLDVLNEKLVKLQQESNATGITLVLIEIELTTKTRDWLRNTMLWDTANGK